MTVFECMLRLYQEEQQEKDTHEGSLSEGVSVMDIRLDLLDTWMDEYSNYESDNAFIDYLIKERRDSCAYITFNLVQDILESYYLGDVNYAE